MIETIPRQKSDACSAKGEFWSDTTNMCFGALGSQCGERNLEVMAGPPPTGAFVSNVPASFPGNHAEDRMFRIRLTHGTSFPCSVVGFEIECKSYFNIAQNFI